MKLIVNADDFGLCEGVNNGIIEAYQNGIVTSTTMLANAQGFDHAVKLLKENPGIAVGVHLALTIGNPVTKCESLSKDGSFYKLGEIADKIATFNPEELRAEFKAQIDKIVSQGIKITHIDGHHHIHAQEGVINIVKELADEYGVVIRNFNNESIDDPYYVAKCDCEFYADKINKEYFVGLKEKYDVVEIMCHPAKLDGVLEKISSYNTYRVEELQVLTTSGLREELENAGITLTTYDKLR